MHRWAGLGGAIGLAVLSACGSGSPSKVGTTQVVFRTALGATPAQRTRTASIMQARFRKLGAPAATVTVQGERLAVSGPKSVRRLAPTVAGRGVIEFRPVLAFGNSPISLSDGGTAMRDRSNRTRYVVGHPAIVGGVRKASADHFTGQGWAIVFSMAPDAKRLFNQLAAESFPKRPPQNSVAIVLDHVVQSAPSFQAPSFSGAVQISGDFTQSEAETIATVLTTGAYPISVQLIR